MFNQVQLEKTVRLASPNLFWTGFARFVTNITAPPFLAIPCFFVLNSYDRQHNLSGSGEFNPNLLIAVMFGAVLPVVIVVALHLMHKVSDVHIAVRQQRTLPLSLTIACFATGTLLLWLVSGPGLLTAVLACYTINTIAIIVINSNWKISVHATGLGGPIAAFTLAFGWAALPLVGLLGLVNWARVYLRAHTLGQVLAGSCLGFGLTLFQLVFVFQMGSWF